MNCFIPTSAHSDNSNNMITQSNIKFYLNHTAHVKTYRLFNICTTKHHLTTHAHTAITRFKVLSLVWVICLYNLIQLVELHRDFSIVSLRVVFYLQWKRHNTFYQLEYIIQAYEMNDSRSNGKLSKHWKLHQNEQDSRGEEQCMVHLEYSSQGTHDLQLSK